MLKGQATKSKTLQIDKALNATCRSYQEQMFPYRRKIMLGKYFRLLVLTFFAFSVSACETMEGFGRDVKKVGGEIEEEADR